MADSTDTPATVAASPFERLRIGFFAVAVFGSLLLSGALQAGVEPQERNTICGEFGLSVEAYGLLTAGIAVAATLLGISAAWVVPRLGAYRVCLLGYAMLAAGLYGVTQLSYGVSILLLGVLTACGMAYLNLANSLVVKLAPARAASPTNILHGINALGKALGPYLILVGSGWRPPFLVMAAMAAALGIVGLCAREPAAPAASTTRQPEEGSARDALRQPLFWGCAALFLPIVGMEQVVVLWLPKHLQGDLHWQPEATVWVAATILWTQCAGRFLAPLLLRRLPAWVLLVFCPVGSLGILAGTEFGAWSGPLGTAGLILCGVAFSTPYPTLFALGCRSFPRHKGLLAVAVGVATSLAFVSFSAIGGILGYRCGLDWTLRLSPLCAAIVIFGALAYLRAAEANQEK